MKPDLGMMSDRIDNTMTKQVEAKPVQKEAPWLQELPVVCP